jgi:hypothetical protein
MAETMVWSENVRHDRLGGGHAWSAAGGRIGIARRLRPTCLCLCLARARARARARDGRRRPKHPLLPPVGREEPGRDATSFPSLPAWGCDVPHMTRRM